MQIVFKKREQDLGKEDIYVFTLSPKELSNLSKSKFGEFLKSAGVKLNKDLLGSEFEGKLGQSVNKEIVTAKESLTTLVLGWDKTPESEFNRINQYRKLGAVLRAVAARRDAKNIAIISDSLDWSIDAHQDALLEGAILSGYSYGRYKSGFKKPKNSLNRISIVTKKFKKSPTLSSVENLCRATFLARDLVNTPAMDCPPAELVKTARQIAKKQRLGIDIYNKAALKRMGAGGILGVSMASAFDPYLIRMKFKSKAKKPKKIAIIGKGVTFDSGGLSIKPGTGMETMKCDMSGAAAVLGTMSVIKELAPKAQVTAYIPTVENMVAANALRPGDIIKHMNGKTVEVLNTDAEGRLILADAITLAVRDGNDLIIDLATLTGACVVALGNDYAGLFSTDENLSKEIIKAGELSGERYWPMPLAQEYVAQLKSPVADLKNIGSRSGGGAITAALFLQQFIGETKKWAHLDIAGPAFRDGDNDISKAGGVGFGVRTLLRYLSGQ